MGPIYVPGQGLRRDIMNLRPFSDHNASSVGKDIIDLEKVETSRDK